MKQSRLAKITITILFCLSMVACATTNDKQNNQEMEPVEENESLEQRNNQQNDQLDNNQFDEENSNLNESNYDRSNNE